MTVGKACQRFPVEAEIGEVAERSLMRQTNMLLSQARARIEQAHMRMLQY
jgi:hypothetical protein